MSADQNGEKVRIVFESHNLDFDEGLRDWLDNKELESAEIKGSGKSVVLVADTDACEAIRKSLRAEDCPRDLYRCFLPPEKEGQLEEVIAGGAFKTDNAETKRAYGRHAPLCAFPSQLARLRSRRS